MAKEHKKKDALKEYNERLAIVDKFSIVKHKGAKKYKKFETMDISTIRKGQDLSQSVDFAIHGQGQ